MLDQLRKQAVRQALAARLLHSLPDALHLLAGLQDLENAVEIDAVVPDVQRAHRGIVDHPFAVASAPQSVAAFAAVAVGQAEMLGGDDDAGGRDA